MARTKKNTKPSTKLPSQPWQRQTAKAQFSELFRRARTEGPQVVTRQGKEQVVVLPAEQFAQLTKRVRQRAETESTEHVYNSLSDDEQTVVSVFVDSGGCVITRDQMNNSSASATGVESLIQRGLLSTSVTADGMRETFVLDSNLFGVGLRRFRKFVDS